MNIFILKKYFHKNINISLYDKYFYKNKKSKLSFGDRVAVQNDILSKYGGSILLQVAWKDLNFDHPQVPTSRAELRHGYSIAQFHACFLWWPALSRQFLEQQEGTLDRTRGHCPVPWSAACLGGGRHRRIDGAPQMGEHLY